MEVEFYKDIPCLETERLFMRKYTIEDVNDYFEFAADANVTKFLRWQPHPNKEFTSEYIQGVLTEYSTGEDGPWGIELKGSQKLIGSVHIMRLDTTCHKKAEIGFFLKRSFWNNGYMTEALTKVFDYSFNILVLNRIEALCVADNFAALRVLEKVVMRCEGLLREYAFQKGEFKDFKLFSILKTNYEERRSSA